MTAVAALLVVLVTTLPTLTLVLYWLNNSQYIDGNPDLNGWRTTIADCPMMDDGSPGVCGWQYFNLHPLLMVLGFSVVLSTGIMKYELLERGFGMSHFMAKAVHASTMTLAMIFLSIALAVVVKFKLHLGYPQFYTAHAIVGLMVYIAAAIQWIMGVLTFFFLSADIRAAFKPYHVWFGVSVFVGAIAAVVSGITNMQQIQGFSGDIYNNYFRVGSMLGVWVTISGWIILLFFVRQKIANQAFETRQEYSGYKSMEGPSI